MRFTLRLKYYHLLLLLLLLFKNVVLGQAQTTVNYTVQDGLPSNQIYDIIEDDYGYLWFSTDKGLSRYNGYEFVNFSLNDGLVDAVVFDFFRDGRGHIWCTTNSNNLFTFHDIEPQFENYVYNDSIQKYAKDLITNGLIVSSDGSVFLTYGNQRHFLEIGPDGNMKSLPTSGLEGVNCTNSSLSVGQQSIGFYNEELYEIGKRPGIEIHKGNQIDELFKQIESASDHSEELHIYCYNFLIDIHHGDRTVTLKRKKKIISTGIINPSSFWVGYANGGCEIIDLKGKVLNHYLSMSSVSQLYIDSEGNTWMSTLNDGLFLLNSTGIGYCVKTQNTNINSISRNRAGSIIYGDSNGNIVELKNWIPTMLIESSAVHKANVLFDPIDSINYFTSNGIYVDGELKVPDTRSNHLAIIKGHYIGFGITGSEIMDLDNDENMNFLFRDSRINDIIDFNDLIYGGGNKGLYYTNSVMDKNHIIVNDGFRVNDLELFTDYLVIGTNGHGIYLMTKNNKILHKISSKEGLCSDFVNKIASENDSTIWVGTNHGISILRISESSKVEIEQLTSEKGLLSNEIWDILFFKDTVWIGTSEGLNYINLKEKKNEFLLPNDFNLHWTDNSIHKSQEIAEEFSYNQNDFTFRYSANKLNGGKDLYYSYQLKGSENESWKLTQSRTLEFSNLPPGSYQLNIHTSFLNGEKSKKGLQYKFVINKAFWNTWWFRALLLLFCLSIGYLFFRIRVFTYNADIVREILRIFLKRINRNEPAIIIRQDGDSIRVKTADICYFKTDGNYIEIYTLNRRYYIRSSIAKLMDQIPDKIEFIQVHRMFVVRFDHIQSKGNMKITVLDQQIPVGRKYAENLNAFDLK